MLSRHEWTHDGDSDINITDAQKKKKTEDQQFVHGRRCAHTRWPTTCMLDSLFDLFAL